MKMNIPKGLFVMAVSLLGQAAAEASTILESDPQSGGISYRWTVTTGVNDFASVKRHVGAWAWEDATLFTAGETPVGWTHNSEWIALKLEADAYVTLRLTNAAGVTLPPSAANPDGLAFNNLYPGMTIYSGWDNDFYSQAFADANSEGVLGHNWHSYVNRGDVEWAEDIHYFAHLEPNGTHVIEETIFMPAGEYTIAVGGKSPSSSVEGRQGYEASFTTSVVPEPGSAVVALIGGTALLARRRKRVS